MSHRLLSAAAVFLLRSYRRTPHTIRRVLPRHSRVFFPLSLIHVLHDGQLAPRAYRESARPLAADDRCGATGCRSVRLRTRQPPPFSRYSRAHGTSQRIAGVTLRHNKRRPSPIFLHGANRSAKKRRIFSSVLASSRRIFSRKYIYIYIYVFLYFISSCKFRIENS